MTKKSSSKPRSLSDKQQQFNNFVLELEKLADRRRLWEDGVQRLSKKELYEILGDCSRLHELLGKTPHLRTKLVKVLKARNVTQTAASSLQLRVIRYVFGQCDEEYNYARVLKAASERTDRTKPFVDWLMDEGGPSGLKKRKVTKKTEQDTNLLLAKAHYSKSKAFATIDVAQQLTPNVNADHLFTVALVRPNSDDPDKLDLVFGSNNPALSQRVLELAGKSVPPGDRKTILEDDQATEDDELMLDLARVGGGRDEHDS